MTTGFPPKFTQDDPIENSENKQVEKEYIQNETTSRPTEPKGLASLKPRKGYFITPLLIYLNVLIFILMVLSGTDILQPESQDLVDWGANFRPVTLEGQLWRLLTSCFLHIGIMHLLLNMYALHYIGMLLEPYLGKTRFVAAYLLAGVTASLTSLWWNAYTVSAGASGAIFGMYGVFLALLTSNQIEKSQRKEFMSSILFFIGYNLLYGLRPDSGIDNAAHIGGLVSGIFIGYAMMPSIKQAENSNLKMITIGILAAILSISCLSINKYVANDVATYQKEIARFDEMDLKAMEAFNMTEETTDEIMLDEIKNKGIYYCKENIKLLDSFQEMDLPGSIKDRNRKLREYCELKIKLFEKMYSGIEEGTNKYEKDIHEYNQKLENILIELATNN